MKRLSISDAWRDAQKILGRETKLLAAVAGVFVLLPAALMGLLVDASTPAEAIAQAGSNPLVWLAQLVELVGMVAIARLALAPESVGEAVKRGFRRLPQLLLAGLIAMLPMAVSLTLLSLAKASGNVALSMVALLTWGFSIYVFLRLSLIASVAAAEEGWAVDLLKRSWALTKGNVLRIFAALVLLLIVIVVATLATSVILSIVTGIASGGEAPAQFSLSALIFVLGGGLVRAIFFTLSVVLFARIYAQLATR